MKIQYVVYCKTYSEWEEDNRFDTYEEAEKRITKSFPADLMGTIEFKIDKIFTNRE